MTWLRRLIGFRELSFLILFLINAAQCYGQRARLFSTDSELSNSLIGDILQDHRGVIWIATEDGINRYDGSKFSVYKEKEGALHKSAGLIFEDSKHNLFFGFSEGLQLYHHDTDSFETIPLILENNTTPPTHVLSMVERRDGTLLVGTSGKGLFTIATHNGQLVARQISNLVPSLLVNLLFEDRDENLWVSTQNKGLFRITGKDGLKNYLDPVKGPDSNIESISQDHEGNIYVGSLNKGLFKYIQAIDSFVQISFPGLAPPAVKELHPMENNQLLIGTDGEGMKLYDAGTDQISSLNFNVSNFDFSKSKVHTIMEDLQGNIWLGLFQKGVVLIPSRTNNFKYIGYQSIANNIIGSNYIMSVYQDHEDVIWVGTDSDGLYKINTSGVQLAHYAPTKKGDCVPSTVMCIYEDSENTIWVGSYLNGLARFNRQNGTFDHVSDILNNQSIPVHRIYSLVEDSQKNLWIGTLGFGLYSLNLLSGEIKNYRNNPNPIHPSDAINNPHSNWIVDLLLAPDDKLFMATADGISCFNLKSKTFTNLNEAYPVLSQSIQSLHLDSLGRLWVGTGQGLLSLDFEKEKLSKFTMEQGLPSDVICAIENDDDQNLWISTSNGISKFNPEDSSFVNYFVHDGLQGKEFSKRAVYKSHTGEIFFGGINGITHFNPNEILETVSSLAVTVTGFYIHDIPVRKGMKSGKYDIIDTAVSTANTFQLSFEDNSFTIEFSAMDFVNPERINYLYSLNDNDWIGLQHGTNTVSFHNLDPGEYIFKVRAKEYNTYSHPKEIAVIIHPAWYFTAGAKAGYILFTLLILTGIVLYIRQRLENKKKLREHLQAEQLNEAKLEFFTNISHDIRTPLSLILSPLKKLIASDDDSTRQQAYKVMRRNTERMLHLVDQLMDLRKIDKGNINLEFKEIDIVEFIKETTKIFEEQILAKNISFQVHCKSQIRQVWIDPNFFDKPIQNLLSNAIKFTPEHGEIDISIKSANIVNGNGHPSPQLRITFSDTGIGLKENEIDKIFNRFYQADNQNQGGNGIGLHLTQSIIKLHHGSIRAQNNPNGPGCQFIISIPLGKEHLEPEEIVSNCPLKDTYTNVKTVIAPLLPHSQEEVHVKSNSKKNVLVVDDDEEVRRYICNELACYYHMHECANGKEALSHVLVKTPDLIISDVVMPEMDGIDLCRKLKQNININHVPIILLTARSKEKDSLKGLGIGADAYITKPFNIELLTKTVQNIIKNREILRNSYQGNQHYSDMLKDIALKSPDEKLLCKVIDIVNDNIDNPELNVEMLSVKIGISRVHLHRKLKELTNQSTHYFIRNIRLQQAANLLSTKHMNISEVAFAVGFTNLAHFSNAFKEFYGKPPTAWMETQKADRSH